jgi:hypothetical protein
VSTHANIYLPYGKMCLYKHFDGRPKDILPVLSQVVNESSIFVRSGMDGAGKQLYKGSKADLLDEMGYLAARIITLFAVLDYRRRTSTGLKFDDRDISGIVSPMSIRVKDDMDADYHYAIGKDGGITYQNVFNGQLHELPYKSDMKNPLYQLAALDDDSEDVDPR